MTATRRTGTRSSGTSRKPAASGRSTGRSATATRRPATGTRRSATAARPRRPEVEVVRRGPSPSTVVVVTVSLLCGLGLVMVYSASSVTAVRTLGNSWGIVARQAMWLGLGVGAAFAASRVPWRVWRDKVALPLMLVSVAALGYVALGVLVQKAAGTSLPFVITVNGATRWVGVGSMQFQPSDLAKPALILWLAKLLSERGRDVRTWEGLKPVLVWSGLTCALVVLGDDLGTTMLLGAVTLAMVFMAGAPLSKLATMGGVSLGLGALAIVGLERFRVTRILAFLEPDKYRQGAGWQLWQSQIGLASGGLFGSGPGLARSKWGFLPEAHTDFILAVIGEELGLAGSLVVLGLFVAFMGAGCAIGMRARSPFGRLVAFGVTTWIGVQALINIGVTVGTLPTKGITLPFVSYGGSSLLMALFGVGILLSVARDA
ncbi:putative lipid II flippase FtsW [Dermatobacter hominis]|uniref:putative lipid II flippase FtsW n=1 Tax=Dermatobacter hominis TaxID=2884263 RepID=UPI001D1052A7|nr:putative lipid II flippase FtsW [Dermatobacter hominis]UDY35976.1 putative lipid II flippase FtsW [Dermatobacter hominis]